MTQRESEAVDRQIELSDGRRLGYAEFGDPEGRPLVYLHPLPGSRLEARLAHPSALRRNVRILAPDRPGYGLSDPHPTATVRSIARDVLELTDRLALESISVLGVSAGGPYALATTVEQPDRIVGAGVVSSFPPLDSPKFRALLPWPQRLWWTRFAPIARRVVSWRAQRYARMLESDPKRVLAGIESAMPPEERSLLARPEIAGLMLDTHYEAFRQGHDAVESELEVVLGDWEFDLGEVPKHVWMWHGEADRLVGVESAREMAVSIPKSTLRVVPDLGHFVVFDVIDDVIAKLVLPGSALA